MIIFINRIYFATMKTDFHYSQPAAATETVALPKETLMARLSRNAIMLVSASMIASLLLLL